MVKGISNPSLHPQGVRAKTNSFLRKIPMAGHTIIFAHMPKAAGISLNVVMKKQYGIRQFLELNPKIPRKAYNDVIEMSIWSLLQLRGLSGHVIWGIHEWLPKPFIYITLLRDPVERILSFYAYARSSPTHRLHNEMIEKKMSLEEFLTWEKSAHETENLQCKLLSSAYPYRETNMPTVFTNAKNNLQQYFLVGLTEQFEKSLELFSGSFGWKNVQVERENVTPNRVKRKDVSPQIIKKIEELNKFDMELYEIGNRLFAEQLRDPRAVFLQKTSR